MRYLVTSTPPTPNGALHIGHLSGPYLAGDILTRHLRRAGGDAVHLSGIDDHQSYTALRALRDGTTPEQVADRFGADIEEGWRRSGVDLDLSLRPRATAGYRELVQEVFLTLWRDGHLVERTRPLPYCTSCRRWAFEAWVVGTCPHCRSGCCGNACEVCGRPNDCADLPAPRCNVCDAPCELRDCSRLYLPLAPHREMIERFHREVTMNAHLTALMHQMGPELPEIAVSHPAEWGIEVPVPGFSEQRVYVWFEMAAGYLAAAREWAARGPDRDDPWFSDRTVVQCFGYDNAYFHALLFPVIMARYAPEVTLPRHFVSNEFYRLDGLKFSTSRRHAIWLLDALDRFPAEHLRLYLSLTRPIAEQTSFTLAGFQDVVQGQLLPGWFDWLGALERRARDLVPSNPTDRPADPLTRRLPHLVELVGDALTVDRFAPGLAVRAIDLMVRESAERGADTDQLRDAPGREDAYAHAVAAEIDAAATVAACLLPIAPEMAGQLWSALGAPGAAGEVPWSQVRAGLHIDTKLGDLVAGCPLWQPRPTA